MKELLLPKRSFLKIIIGILLIQFVCINLVNGQQSAYTKESALKKVQELLKDAPFKMKSNNKLEKFVQNSTHNFDAIVYITELSTKIGYHTETYIAIAEIASKATHEIEELKEIAELNGMKLTGTGGLIDLAKQAEKVKTEEERKKLKAEIAKLRSNAEFKTIEEAIDSQ